MRRRSKISDEAGKSHESGPDNHWLYPYSNYSADPIIIPLSGSLIPQKVEEQGKVRKN